MRGQIFTQTLNGKISIDNAHKHTDKKQKNKNLYRVIEKEVDSNSQMGFCA